MGAYTTIAGWIQIPERVRPDAIEVINASAARFSQFDLTPDQVALYNSGWLVQASSVNGALFVFFGAQVRTSAVPFIKAQVAEISKLKEENVEFEYVIFPEGCFSVEEDGTYGDSPKEWLITGGSIMEREKVAI